MIQKSKQSSSSIKILKVLLVSSALITLTAHADEMTDSKLTSKPVLSDEERAGKEVVFSRKKGNCLACHMIQGAEATGNIGPPLILIQTRFPDKNKLRTQIWDSTARNPESSMPPFGRHKILSEKEIDQATAYVWTL